MLAGDRSGNYSEVFREGQPMTMTFARLTTLTISMSAAFILVAPEVQSRPKSVHHICGAEDSDRLRDPAAQAGIAGCVKKTNEDLASGLPASRFHYLLCLLDGGISCCQDSASGESRTCDRIMRTDAGGVGGSPTISPGKPSVPKLPGEEIFNRSVKPQ